jgi:hypothetical protein
MQVVTTTINDNQYDNSSPLFYLGLENPLGRYGLELL